MAAMAPPPPPRRERLRFRWRERCERIDWRLLRSLDLPEVLRRGDPALLEPFALHVTFARLPTDARETRDRDRDRDRGAWFLVRLLQLAMEFLLFVRSRDSDTVDSLAQQLQQCERERDNMLVRARKWKVKAASGERQVDKLHQVLHNIAKLLQVHGASASAVATIETMLTDLVAERQVRRQGKKQRPNQHDGMTEDDIAESSSEKNHSICGLCGKLFSSRRFLDKHIARRHADSSRPETLELPQQKPKVRRDDHEDIHSAAFQTVMERFEHMLNTHEENFRMLSAQEATRVQQMYEQLHTEIHLPERVKEALPKDEKKLREQDALQSILRQKEEADAALMKIKEDITMLALKRDELLNSINTTVPCPQATPLAKAPECPVDEDALASTRSEVNRLQASLEEVNQALADTRTKLARLQTDHLSAIREKQMLIDRLDQARDKIDALEEAAASSVAVDHSERYVPRVEVLSPPTPIAPVTIDAFTQASAVDCNNAETQTTDSPIFRTINTSPEQKSCREFSTQTADTTQAQNMMFDVGIQTILDDFEGGRDPINPSIDIICDPEADLVPVSRQDIQEQMNSIPDAGLQGVNAVVPEYVQRFSCQELVDAVLLRADRAATKSVSKNDYTKPCAPIARRKFLRSQYPHSESLVKDRIKSCLERLDKFSDRFGVSSRNGSQLSTEHFSHVRQALHAHLEMLPTDVLERMIECENKVNRIIETEWVPLEVTRQGALDKLKVETQKRSLLNQELVKQAMSMFEMRATPHIEDKRLPILEEITNTLQAIPEPKLGSTTMNPKPAEEMIQIAQTTTNQQHDSNYSTEETHPPTEYKPKSIATNSAEFTLTPESSKGKHHDINAVSEEIRVSVKHHFPGLQATYDRSPIGSPSDLITKHTYVTMNSPNSTAVQRHGDGSEVKMGRVSLALQRHSDNHVSCESTSPVGEVEQHLGSESGVPVRDPAAVTVSEYVFNIPEENESIDVISDSSFSIEEQSPKLADSQPIDNLNIAYPAHLFKTEDIFKQEEESYHKSSEAIAPTIEDKPGDSNRYASAIPPLVLRDSFALDNSLEASGPSEPPSSAILSSVLSFAESIPSILSDGNLQDAEGNKCSGELSTDLQSWRNNDVDEDQDGRISATNDDWENIKRPEAYPTAPQNYHNESALSDAAKAVPEKYTTMESSPTATSTRPAVHPIVHDDDEIEEIELT